MFYVYIIRLRDNSLYTGYTKNIENRLNQHRNKKGSKYVMARLPLTLVYTEEFETRSEAMKREIKIKKLTRRKKLQLMQNFTDKKS